MDMSSEEDNHSAHYRGPGLKGKQRQNQNHKSKIWHCSSTRDFFFGNSGHSWCFYSHSGQLLRCPECLLSCAETECVRNLHPIFLAASRGCVGDWPRPASPGGSTLSSGALIAPSNSQLISYRVALGHVRAVSIWRLCISHLPPEADDWQGVEGNPSWTWHQLRGIIYVPELPMGPHWSHLSHILS